MAYRLRGRYGYPQDDPFAVTFHEDRLHEPSQRKKPAKIFTCSMGELFDLTVKSKWIRWIFSVMQSTPRHTFQVLTKQPDTAHDWNFPENVWLGVSQDGKYTDVVDIWPLLWSNARVKFVSFEPLLGPVAPRLKGLDWVIIGAQTGPGAVPPRKEWVEDIIREARIEDVPVFLKDNLYWKEQVREWPRGAER